MGKNSKTKRDQKKKKLKKQTSNNAHSSPIFGMPSSLDEMVSMQNELNKLFSPASLTTPKKIDANIVEFCHQISDFNPIFLNIVPEDWSRQSCCDLNVQEYIKVNAGRIICGYKIWYNEPNYIEGERHAVWQGDDGTLKDITFNADGEENILFIADITEKQSSLEANKQRIRWCKTEKVKSLIAFQEQTENFIPTQRMSDEVAWNTAITYKDWCDGKRMPNQFIKIND
ncbi:hypothetical protein [uncultured Tolumonas sp.]|uniref:hypothetical protein n=1 Tax=uncultured Tolumonas sp. TaxID=263765 RepID=UPI002931085B|nr:hypothetical protein [uncultured Tolumonas sp.]